MFAERAQTAPKAQRIERGATYSPFIL